MHQCQSQGVLQYERSDHHVGLPLKPYQLASQSPAGLDLPRTLEQAGDGSLILMDMPLTLDQAGDGFPFLRVHRLAGIADGFHELRRRYIANGAVRSTVVVLESERLAF